MDPWFQRFRSGRKRLRAGGSPYVRPCREVFIS